MNMNADDWRGEGFIRAPRKVEVEPHASRESIATAARIKDADAIRPLAATKTKMEIQKITGLSGDRIYQVCKWFDIHLVDHAGSGRKRKRAK